MERGRLHVFMSTKGKWVGEILFEIAGKQQKLTIPAGLIRDGSLNGKETSFKREEGQVVSLICEGKELMRPMSSSANQHASRKGTSTGKGKPSAGGHKAQSLSGPACAPYNFVPLNDLVVEIENPTSFGFHTYHQDRHTGFIDLQIEAVTPLYIRDTINPKDKQWKEADGDKKSGQANPDFFSPGGRIRIPGSSIRGMTRTLVEVVSFGKFGFCDEKRRLYFRGLADKSNLRGEYQKRMTSVDKTTKKARGKFSSGVLKRRGLSYFIVSSGSNYRQIPKDQAMKMVKSQGAKYEDFKDYKLEEGFLVVSGPMPKKKKDWLIDFPGPEASELPIPREDVKSYMDDQTRADQVPNLIKLAKTRPEGVPCFYVIWKDSKGKDRVSFGHTGMFRLAYQKSIGDHIPGPLKATNSVDIAGAIFGNEKTFAGRVFFEDAFLCQGQKDVLMPEATPRILSSPKPTTFQHYLEQSSENLKELKHYDTGAHIRGNKFYWHKAGQEWAENDNKKIEAHSTQYTKIRPVKPGTKFAGRIRFENLSDIELGALLFSLDLPPGCMHKLGMGKPLGLGSIKIKPVVCLSDRKNRYQHMFSEWNNEIEKSENVPHFKGAFESYVAGKLNISTKEGLWNTERLKELACLLNYEKGVALERVERTRYMAIEPDNEFKDRRVLPRPTKVKGN